MGPEPAVAQVPIEWEPEVDPRVCESPEALEAHVRAAAAAAGDACSLDLTVATAQSFSGFSGFGAAEAELRRSLPPGALERVLGLCEHHGVRDAFQARRESVNLKKVALLTLWEAEELEHRLLRLSLVCFVGDTTTNPVDAAWGNVYYFDPSNVDSSPDPGPSTRKVSRPATASEVVDHVAAALALLRVRLQIPFVLRTRLFLILFFIFFQIHNRPRNVND